MNKSVIAGLILFFVSLTSTAAIVDFDDLTPDPAVGWAKITEPYAGFDWANFGYFDPLDYTVPNSGYINAIVSPSNIAYNGYGDEAWVSSSEPFEFVGTYLTSVFNEGLVVTVNGYLHGLQVETKAIVTSCYHPTWSSFDWVVDGLSFSAAGGEPIGFESGTWFAMDNFTYTPEPATMCLLGLGGVLLRRRRA